MRSDFRKAIPLTMLDWDMHVIFVRDSASTFHLNGVRGLGVDYPDCVRRMGSIAAELGAADLRVLGYSAGGYAGLCYGLDLGVSRVLCFGSPTSLDLSDEPLANFTRYPQLRKLYRVAPKMARDAGRLYAEAVRRPHVYLCFGELHRRDAMFARRMEGIEGVTLIPLLGYAGHLIDERLRRTGELLPLLERVLLRDGPQPAVPAQAEASRQHPSTPISGAGPPLLSL